MSGHLAMVVENLGMFSNFHSLYRTLDHIPIVQLVQIHDDNSFTTPRYASLALFSVFREEDAKLFVCHASLAHVIEDKETPIIKNKHSIASNEAKFVEMVYGTPIDTAEYYTDLDGKNISVFIFPDVSIRAGKHFQLYTLQGREYRLKFKLFRLGMERCYSIHSLFSRPFRVYQPVSFPGKLSMLSLCIFIVVSDLSRHFAEQGAKINVRGSNKNEKLAEIKLKFQQRLSRP